MNRWLLGLCLGLVLFLSIETTGAEVNLDAQGNLPRATPESQGISSETLVRLVERLRDEITAPNSLMVLRHGQVVAECYWPPYSPQTTHALYSLSKSFTSTAAGFAVSEGKLRLEDKLVDLFAQDLPADFANPVPTDKYDFLKKARLRDLLSMSGGQKREPGLKGLFPLDFSRPESGETWQKTFFTEPFCFEPGTHFLYNTAGTFMVSAAVQQATGQTVRDYLVPRLFKPLNIDVPFWEQSPNGISKGGTGLFLKTEDIAKFGQFCLQRGIWNGKRLLPAEWFDQAASKQSDNGIGSDPNSDWKQGYGFQFWLCRFGVYRGDGMYSQFMIVFPKQDMVVAITSDSNQYQGIVNIVFEQLIPQTGTPAVSETPLPENPQAQAAFGKLASSLPSKDGASPSVTLENLRLPSKILQRDTTFFVYLPKGYLTSGLEYPVLYLLHGGGDQGDAWLKKGNLKSIADQAFQDKADKAIVVMPYCQNQRWRNDIAGEYRYEDYFMEELIPHIESLFRCRKDRDSRAIAGLSRGGYGALFLSLKRPDVFGTCFAMSPTIRTHEFVRSLPESEFLRMYPGCLPKDYQSGDDRINDFYLRHDILNLVTQVPENQKNAVRFFIDCGDSDIFIEGARLLDKEMTRLGIPHQFLVRPGSHTWEYWQTSLKTALPFFMAK